MSQEPEWPPREKPVTSEELRFALAAQRSYLGPATAVVFLYIACYVPGLIFNWLWMAEALRIRRVTGVDPPGLKTLQVMFILGLVPLIFWTALLIDCSGRIMTSKQPTPTRAPMTRVVPRAVPVEIPVPVFQLPTPRPSPTPRPKFLPGQRVRPRVDIMCSESMVRRAPAITLPAGTLLIIQAQERSAGRDFLKCTVSRKPGELFTGYVANDDLAAGGFTVEK